MLRHTKKIVFLLSALVSTSSFCAQDQSKFKNMNDLCVSLKIAIPDYVNDLSIRDGKRALLDNFPETLVGISADSLKLFEHFFPDRISDLRQKDLKNVLGTCFKEARAVERRSARKTKKFFNGFAKECGCSILCNCRDETK